VLSILDSSLLEHSSVEYIHLDKQGHKVVAAYHRIVHANQWFGLVEFAHNNTNHQLEFLLLDIAFGGIENVEALQGLGC
jgi:hypothetical protein